MKIEWFELKDWFRWSFHGSASAIKWNDGPSETPKMMIIFCSSQRSGSKNEYWQVKDGSFYKIC